MAGDARNVVEDRSEATRRRILVLELLETFGKRGELRGAQAEQRGSELRYGLRTNGGSRVLRARRALQRLERGLGDDIAESGDGDGGECDEDAGSDGHGGSDCGAALYGGGDAGPEPSSIHIHQR